MCVSVYNLTLLLASFLLMPLDVTDSEDETKYQRLKLNPGA